MEFLKGWKTFLLAAIALGAQVVAHLKPELKSTCDTISAFALAATPVTIRMAVAELQKSIGV